MDMRREKKVFAFFLSLAMMIGLFVGTGLKIQATQATPLSDVTTVYFDNSVTGWSEAYAYVWSDNVSAKAISGTKVATNVYKFSIPAQYTKILFKNTSGTSGWDKQTADLNIPTADGQIFVPSSSSNKTGGSWKLYSPETAIPTVTPTIKPTGTPPADVTLYYNNTKTSWSNVYAYVWSSGISAKVYSATKVATNIYKFSIPKQYTNILFKNTSGTSNWDKQTADTYVPTGKANCYMPYSADNKTNGYWYEYADDTEELTANWSYTLRGTTISLNDYIGTSTEVTVKDYYYINGTKYTTVFPSSASYNGPFIGNSQITKVTFQGTGMLTNDSVPYLFQNCKSLKTVVGFGGNFTNMDNTFRYCSALDCQLTIPASVTTAEYAFYECYGLSTMPILPKDSRLQVANFMFYCCTQMKASSLSLPSNLTTMNTMFYYCKKLSATDIVIPDNVIEASYAFGTCEGLTVLPTIKKSSKLVKASGMFSGCLGATSGDLYLPSTLTNAAYMFNNCRMLGGSTGTGFYLHSYIDATSAEMTAIFDKVGYDVHTGGGSTYKDCIVYVKNASATTDAQYTAMAAYVNPPYMTLKLASESNRRALVLGETSTSAVPILDVTSMVEMFRHCTFDKENMLEIVQYNDRTKAQITSQIKSMFRQNTENDVSYIYMCCHGSPNGSIFIGSDGGYYTPAELRTLFDTYVKGEVVLMVNCCYAGNLVQADKESEEEDNFANTFIEQFIAGTEETDGAVSAGGNLASKRYHVICSSTKNEESWSYSNLYSIATRYWEFGCGWDEKKGVKTSLLADTNSDNKVTLAELYDYAYEKVVHEVSWAEQHMVVYPENDDFVVAGRY